MPRGEHRSSILLSRDENEQVFGLIGPKCQSLATAVVQLFTTEGPGHTEWKKKDTGVLCLIKDNSKRSYFFRIYCLYRRTMIWEHEVYLQIEYKSPRPYLHTFEAEEYMTAFNFANEDEARILRNTLIEKIELRKQKREERRNRALLAQRANSVGGGGGRGVGSAGRYNGAPPAPPAAAPTPAAPHSAPPAPALPPKANNSIPGGYTIKSSSKKPKSRKLTKADIGMPQDFKHISHVGWDANKGFDVDNLPEEEMRSFFSKAGISETQLQDQDTRQFIYDFINTHGGFDAVKEELHDDKPVKPASTKSSIVVAALPPPPPPAPPVPARSPAPHHPPHTPHPPAPPSRAPPPPPSRAVPPPPPPPATAAPPPAPPAPRHPPPPRPTQPPSSAPPPAPPPPPPPPPAAGAAAPPPPPPPAPGAAAAAPDPRAALMESIRSGAKSLRKVEAGAGGGGNGSGGGGTDSRSNLLSEIRQGIELKAVPKADPNVSEKSVMTSSGCGLADALKRALDERSRAIHSDTDSDDNDNTDNDSGDDWD